MGYRIYKPHNCLSDFIKYYWLFELDSNPHAVHKDRVIPSGEPQMIFHYHTPFTEVSNRNRASIQPQSVICGQQTGYKDIIVSASLGMIAVVFQPYALRAFLPNPINEFTNESISLDYLFQAEIRELQDRIIEASTIHSRLLLIEKFLLNKLSVSNSFAVAREAVNLITSTKGQLTVSEIADRLYLSKRQFERIFLTNVGIPPKKFGSIIRFNTSIQSLEKANSLTMQTYEAGYFDQSHWIRDFRQFTGLPPKEFLKQTCLI